MYIRFAKTNPSAFLPKRAHPTDAGLDIRMPSDKSIVIKAGEQAMVDSGLKVEVPYGYMLMAANKSGIATKKELILGAHIIDTFYKGPLIINLHNIGTQDQLINPGDGLCQMILIPIVCAQTLECREDELYKDFELGEIRGESGFGSGHTK